MAVAPKPDANQRPRQPDCDDRTKHAEDDAFDEHLPHDVDPARRGKACAISRMRADARASSIPATLAQAINSTRPTTAMTAIDPIDNGPLACGTSSRTSDVGNTLIRRVRFVSG